MPPGLDGASAPGGAFQGKSPARGADQATTSAIDSHVQAEQQSGNEDDDDQAGTLAPVS
jgi:hypothetical protein